MAEYAACPGHSKPPSFLSFLRQRNPHVFSHHDHTQPDYRDHVLRCSGLFICRGCTVVFLTSIVALAVTLLSRWPALVSTPVVASSFVLLLGLSLVPLRKSPRTLVHDLRRAALGCLLGSAAAYLVLCDDWILRGIVVGVYVGVLVVRQIIRRSSRFEPNA